VRLEATYAPGHYRVTTRQEQKQTMQIGEMQIRQSNSLVTVQRANVSEPDSAGELTLTITYTRIKQNRSMGGRELTYDSEGADEANNPLLAKIFDSMVGAELTATVGADGQIRKLRGMNAIWETVSERLGSQAALGIESLKKQLGNNRMVQMMQAGRRMLPQKPVKPGHQWKSQTRLQTPMTGELTSTADCRLQDIRESSGTRIAIIDCIGKASSEGGTTAVGKTQVQIRKIELDQHTTLQLDLGSGMILRRRLEQSGPVVLSMPGAQGQAQEITIQQEMTLTTEWEKIEK
jgi:hypothetical protein